MQFNYSHRPLKKERRPWYENALLLAVAGSIIIVMGQLAGTLIPIMYGAADASDFSISINPSGIYTYESVINSSFDMVHVTVEDTHPYLRPYRFNVFLRALDVQNGITIWFDPPEVKPTGASQMHIKFNNYSIKEYPIVIQGMGGDGKIRNSTFYVGSLGGKIVRSADANTPN